MLLPLHDPTAPPPSHLRRRNRPLLPLPPATPLLLRHLPQTLLLQPHLSLHLLRQVRPHSLNHQPQRQDPLFLRPHLRLPPLRRRHDRHRHHPLLPPPPEEHHRPRGLRHEHRGRGSERHRNGTEEEHEGQERGGTKGEVGDEGGGPDGCIPNPGRRNHRFVRRHRRFSPRRRETCVGVGREYGVRSGCEVQSLEMDCRMIREHQRLAI
ncbi:uncharacterized protein HKW66_Vig0167070 [Vigna angularis]|uniref:Uncharacterized protein n=1 Tax=Phaseolus angularis TaxID=3914 RepID=A0A8T0JNU3_PHAAN|nr:uncharacterized protein HKW66_Vig0167070 [Vigna angularis]